ncbi:MAG: threonylcarbamoyl-AMP synthase [Clostridiales bacterium]|nr:threonylcarbamoyl-AMP synthase [Clostridiales bacterium]MBQ3107277.1 threonylcarbamoyl-AMP synthase [Bacillota bacterium]
METIVCKLEHDGPAVDPVSRERLDLAEGCWTEEEQGYLQKAGDILAAGGLVAFPTETVYGLGANALDPDAAAKIYEAKGRPSDNPLIVHIADVNSLFDLAEPVSEDALLLAEAFWPGPMTMILPKKDCIPDVTTGGLPTVAIRMPDSAAALELIRRAGCPVAAPSANLSGKPSPTHGEHVIHDMIGRIPMILWGRDCRVGIESTIIDLTQDTPAVLRPGFLTTAELAEVLGREVIVDPAILETPSPDLIPRAPGMKYKHYAPSAPMTIYRGSEDAVKQAIAEAKAAAEAEGKEAGIILFSPSAFEEAAHDLFADLREMDHRGVDLILAGALQSEDERGFAIMNRMLKSAGYHVVDVE